MTDDIRPDENTESAAPVAEVEPEAAAAAAWMATDDRVMGGHFAKPHAL